MNEYPEGFVEWLANGERGLSSDCIATVLSGLDCMSRDFGLVQYPRDPSDFIRCEKLLARVPSFAARLDEMKYLSKEWRSLVEHWSEISEAIKLDLSINPNKCPTAYNLMQKILVGAK